jgi:threonine aldolase
VLNTPYSLLSFLSFSRLNLKEIVEPFDSVYISFYKGLGGLSGAMLMGDAKFCQEARVWLRRLGGNLYTLMPYIISAHAGYHKHVIDPCMTFTEKKEKLQRIIQRLSSDPLISAYVTFDPKIPETNMVHGYMTTSIEECKTAIQEVEKVTGIRILSRIRPVEANERAKQLGYQTKFEWTMGSANGAIDDNQFLNGWRAFSHCFSQPDK